MYIIITSLILLASLSPAKASFPNFAEPSIQQRKIDIKEAIAELKTIQNQISREILLDLNVLEVQNINSYIHNFYYHNFPLSKHDPSNSMWNFQGPTIGIHKTEITILFNCSLFKENKLKSLKIEVSTLLEKTTYQKIKDTKCNFSDYVPLIDSIFTKRPLETTTLKEINDQLIADLNPPL